MRSPWQGGLLRMLLNATVLRLTSPLQKSCISPGSKYPPSQIMSTPDCKRKYEVVTVDNSVEGSSGLFLQERRMSSHVHTPKVLSPFLALFGLTSPHQHFHQGLHVAVLSLKRSASNALISSLSNCTSVPFRQSLPPRRPIRCELSP